MRILPMGIDAVIVEGPPTTPAAWALGLRRLGVAGLVDVVPAAETVLVRCADEAALREVLARLDDVVPVPVSDATGTVTIDVVYDGEDLAEVAGITGLDADDVVRLHVGAQYRVAFCGFAPGFGYLTGLPTRLQVPRRASPRTRVPAGAVAIAASYAAVYPRPSPGGWNLIGTTDHVLFDVRRDPPAVLQPGTTVRFRRVA
jgi:KipI family sensor histidine kinase inhibitor